MLSKEKQLKEWDRVVDMCKGTKFEGREHHCVKYKGSLGYIPYSHKNHLNILIDFDRIFAVAIIDDTPIWIEEPFKLYTREKNELIFSYDKDENSLIGVNYYPPHLFIRINIIRVIIPLDSVLWSNFTLTKPTESLLRVNLEDPKSKVYTVDVDTKQVGGAHYKDKAIQPWTYMEANFTKEEFTGFLQGNAFKYLARYKEKNGVEDLKKAIHYIEKLIQVEGTNGEESIKKLEEPKLNLSVYACKQILGYGDSYQSVLNKLAAFVKDNS